MEILLTHWGSLRYQVHNLFVDLRVQNLEREILKLQFDSTDAESMSKRSIDLQSFLSLALGGFLGHVLPSSGVMQSVSQFDDENSDVLGHGNYHFSDGLCLSAISELDLV